MTLGGTAPLGPRTVHRIGFGAMQLPGPGVLGPPRDRDEALRVVRRAVEAGVDHVDTAQYYGPRVANELLREALGGDVTRVCIVSKVGADRDDTGRWLPAGRPEQLRQGVLDNLSTLGIDQVPVVNLRLPEAGHPEFDVPFDEQVDAMAAMVDEGLIGDIGLSNVSLDQLTHALDRVEVVCVQNALNVLDRRSLPVLHATREQGIAFTPFFPLGSAFGGVNKVLTHADVLAVAERLAATPSQVALAWLLALAPNVLLIPGTSSLGHLGENLSAGDVVLDAEARQVLDALAA